MQVAGYRFALNLTAGGGCSRDKHQVSRDACQPCLRRVGPSAAAASAAMASSAAVEGGGRTPLDSAPNRHEPTMTN